jgi:hypothetical protein
MLPQTAFDVFRRVVPLLAPCFPQGIGYGLSVAAFFWYQRIKMQQISGEASRAALSASGSSASLGGDKGGEGLPRYHAVASSDALEEAARKAAP